MRFLTLLSKNSLHVVLICVGFIAGILFRNPTQNDAMEQPQFLTLNGRAPLLWVDGQQISFEMLPVASQLEILGKVIELNETAQRHSQYQAALAFELKAKSWVDLLNEKLSESDFKNAYSTMPSFNTMGSFSEVEWDIERYLISKERAEVSGKFIDKKRKSGAINFNSPILPSVVFERTAADFPVVHLGLETGKNVEIDMVFQYAGNKHLLQLTEIDAAAKSAGIKLKLRVISEATPHPYNQEATKLLLCAQQIGPSSKMVLQLHEWLSQTAPASHWYNKARGEELVLKEKLITIDKRLQSCRISDDEMKRKKELSREISRLRINKEPFFVSNSKLYLRFIDALAVIP